uniref:hypothetical protein n=1 Tax=Scytonema sp. HK-05 TaxID=1137095 RepID=UPI001E38D689|nr:hypothetical protein [Scytonema sp. HK-05]
MTANLISKLKVSIATKCIDQIPIFKAIAPWLPMPTARLRRTGVSRTRVRVRRTQRALRAIA